MCGDEWRECKLWEDEEREDDLEACEDELEMYGIANNASKKTLVELSVQNELPVVGGLQPR